jgi:hypothetical protein
MIAKRIWLPLFTITILTFAALDARAQSAERTPPQEAQLTVSSGGIFDTLARLKKAVAGSWLATVTIPGGPPPFKALFTFTEDGNVITPAQGGVTANSVFTPAHGAWRHLGGRSFGFTAVSIVYSPTTGALAGLFKLRGTVALEGDEWSGMQKSEFFNPAGTLVFAGEATMQAQRIKVEPLP